MFARFAKRGTRPNATDFVSADKNLFFDSTTRN
jgi:hypothetical protein